MDRRRFQLFHDPDQIWRQGWFAWIRERDDPHFAWQLGIGNFCLRRWRL